MQPTQAMMDSDWIVAVNSQMDTLPDSPADFAEPSYVGWLDYRMGLEPQPLEYYVKLGDIEQYLWGYKDAQEADDLREAREDYDFWRQGGAW